MKFKRYIKKPAVYIPLIILIVIAAGVMLFGGGGNGDNVTTSVAKVLDIQQKVSVTGRIKPASDVSLAFEKGGRVRVVAGDVGKRVSPGSLLASLENGDLVAQLAQAQASVKAAQAKLDELKRGSTAEELLVEETKLRNAQNDLENAKRTAIDTVESMYTNVEDAIHNSIDTFFSNARSASPQFNFTAESKGTLELSRVQVESLLSDWKKTVAEITPENLDTQIALAKKNLATVKSFIEQVASAINALTPSASLTQATIDSHKSTVQSARSAISAQVGAATSAGQSIRTAQDTLTLQQSQLALKRTPTRPEQIDAQEAQVEQAQANAQNIEAQLGKTILRSPIEGVITSRDVDPGEIVGANVPVMTIISTDKFRIEANVAESDIADIKLKDTAEVTLDAYPGATFIAEVISIDPAETIVEGVPTYKVTLRFTTDDARIKSGLTANTDVVTAEAKQAIVVPSRAVYLKDGKKYVKIQEDDKGEVIREAEVTTGIRDGEGGIQILSGVKEGDIIVVSSAK